MLDNHYMGLNYTAIKAKQIHKHTHTIHIYQTFGVVARSLLITNLVEARINPNPSGYCKLNQTWRCQHPCSDSGLVSLLKLTA